MNEQPAYVLSVDLFLIKKSLLLRLVCFSALLLAFWHSFRSNLALLPSPGAVVSGLGGVGVVDQLGVLAHF